MQYTHLEKLGIKISKLGFGAMRLPETKLGDIDQDHLQEMVDYSMLSGINYYDTAAVYYNGKSEIALGKALKKFKRSEFYVADKMPLWSKDSAKNLDKIFETSLSNMQLEYFDFYLMHSLSKASVNTMKDAGAIKWAKEKQEEGKIKYLGFSIHDDDELLEELLRLHNWDFVQIQYNYIDLNDRPGQKGYNRLVAAGIPIIIMEPLKGGILANIEAELAEPFTKLGGSPASYSFRWLAEQPGIATILSGMSNLDQVVDNVTTFKNITPLNKAEQKAVEAVAANIQRTQKVPCTGCGYCMPCPSGVKIPTNFKNWNNFAMRSKQWVSGTEIDYDNARLCIDCGVCKAHCPQAIDIPKKISDMISEKK